MGRRNLTTNRKRASIDGTKTTKLQSIHEFEIRTTITTTTTQLPATTGTMGSTSPTDEKAEKEQHGNTSPQVSTHRNVR